ncbi:MAG: hypothetical protein U0W24_22175 [Bacteroidales bacterium]
MYTNKDKLLELILGCPDSNVFHTGDCPFQFIWKLELEKRFELINALDESVINELLDYHRKRCCESGCDSTISTKIWLHVLGKNNIS